MAATASICVRFPCGGGPGGAVFVLRHAVLSPRAAKVRVASRAWWRRAAPMLVCPAIFRIRVSPKFPSNSQDLWIKIF